MTSAMSQYVMYICKYLARAVGGSFSSYVSVIGLVRIYFFLRRCTTHRGAIDLNMLIWIMDICGIEVRESCKYALDGM